MSINPLILSVPLLVAAQSWLAGPGSHLLRRPKISLRFHDNAAIGRLIKRFDFNSSILDLTIRISKGSLVTMTVTRLVPATEVEALSDWINTEDLTLEVAAETGYHLVRRPDHG